MSFVKLIIKFGGVGAIFLVIAAGFYKMCAVISGMVASGNPVDIFCGYLSLIFLSVMAILFAIFIVSIIVFIIKIKRSGKDDNKKDDS
jgi:uncharacterized membrane protein